MPIPLPTGPRASVRRALHGLSLVIVLSFAATACRTVALQPTEVSSEAVLLTMPIVPQDELYECGLATMSALCEYYGRTIPEDERDALVETASREQGLSGAELRSALVAAGFEVWIFPGTLDHDVSGLYRHVDGGRPLLVMISPDRESNHYCLFTGYDPEHGNVFLLDPRRGSLVIPAASFASLWRKARSFTLLAMPTAERLTASFPPL